MSLDTYDNLKLEVADWLNRADLVAKVPTFITLLEAQVRRAQHNRSDVVIAPLTISTNIVALPADYKEMRRLRLTDTDLPSDALDYASEAELDRIEADLASNTGDQPKSYCIIGQNIRVAPQPDRTYAAEISYYAKLAALSSGNQTNWLLTDHPDIYLYGALAQAAPYLKDDERLPMWQSVLTTFLEDLRVSNERAENAGKPLRARIRPYGVLRPPR